MLTFGESFKYGYNNSSDPATPLGLPNQTGGPYIYDGTPIPPTPTPTTMKKGFNWAVFTKNIRQRGYR